MTILNKAVKKIDSSTVYMEADLFYFLTNENHVGKMVKTMEGGRADRRHCELHRVR